MKIEVRSNKNEWPEVPFLVMNKENNKDIYIVVEVGLSACYTEHGEDIPNNETKVVLLKLGNPCYILTRTRETFDNSFSVFHGTLELSNYGGKK